MPTPRTTIAATAALGAILLAACGGATEDPTATVATADATATATGATAATATAATAVSGLSCEAVAAAFATRGSANDDLVDPVASATCDGDTVTVTANGIPDFPYVETSPGDPQPQDLVYELPADPQIADEVTEVPRLGAVAVATNGVPIYGPTEGSGGDVASLDALSECGGHNGPTGYHYHTHGTADAGACLHTPEDLDEDAPALFGFAFDGFPIYLGEGTVTSSWELTDASLFATDTWAAHTYVEGSGDLDQCNGQVDDGGYYAYYTTDEFPYVIGCYRGEVELTAAGGQAAGGSPAGGPPPTAG